MIDLGSAQYEGGFVCDEVRVEANGKLFAIGMYTGGIVLDTLPVDLGMCLAMRITPKRLGDIPFRLRAMMDGERLMELQGSLTATVLRSSFLPSPRFPVPIRKLGDLIFEISETGDDWHSLFDISVEPSPTFSSSAEQPPS